MKDKSGEAKFASEEPLTLTIWLVVGGIALILLISTIAATVWCVKRKQRRRIVDTATHRPYYRDKNPFLRNLAEGKVTQKDDREAFQEWATEHVIKQ
jgi:hypothetical protein